jgi:membrane-bound lytic murein transglycosylase D
MHRAAWLPVAAACSVSILSGCSVGPRPQLPGLPPPSESAPALTAPPAPVPAIPSDPTDLLIARADAYFEAGRLQFDLGHLDRAKREFDLAVDVLLRAPGGARADAKLRAYFDRLVDRVNAFELTALAQGDGFTERGSEPAMIDELLDVSTFTMPAPAATTREAIEREIPRHEIPITLEPKVLAYVELFQGRLRDWFLEALERGVAYLPMIQSVFAAEGLPIDLAYVPIVESAFKPTALSRAKARGVWQFMPGTAVENGLRYDWYVDERADPEKATRAAAKYLKTLSATFDGDWHLALASYNGGPGRVQRAIKRAKTADFWKLRETSQYLPRETREYVPMILAAIVIAGNPTQFGFLPQPVPLAPSERATLRAPVDLRKVAEWTGTSVDAIQALNPELRRWTTPLKDRNYAIAVPEGTAAALEERIRNAAPGELISVAEYVVRKGDTLSVIGQRMGVRWQDIADANSLTKRSLIRPGQRLLVPMAPSAALARTGHAEADASGRQVHRVQRGDTLSKIARRYAVTVDSIKTWNKLKSSRINIGDRLTIYARGSQ